MAARSEDAGARPAVRTFALLSALVALVAGVLLRLVSRSDLWLDEALSVNIATLPLGDMVDALRRDGHPPLYYVLLHGWTSVFGEGDEAVRSLSGVFALATLPVFWIGARRYGREAGGREHGRGAALAAVVLLATNPFAIRYATEARMYALVTLLAATGWLCLRVALERRSRLALVGVGVSAGLLLLAHYWSFYLVAATGALLLLLWRRGNQRARAALLALAVGCLLFLPWLPSFLDQAGSTGTPWGKPERPTNVLTISLRDWGGGTLDGLKGEPQLLGFGIGLLVLLALFARPIARHLVEVDVRTLPHARPEVVVVVATMALAILAGYATDSAFASRYTAGVFPIVLLVAAYGVTRLPSQVLQGSFVALLAVLGLVGGVDNLGTQRTQGGEIARYIAANGTHGDVVAFCPDQLGPAVMRVLGQSSTFSARAYPDGGTGRFVDWVDYEDRNAAADPAAFASMLDGEAGQHTVWLVWSGGYRTLGTACEALTDQLRRLRPGGTGVVASSSEFEHAWLFQYGPVPAR